MLQWLIVTNRSTGGRQSSAEGAKRPSFFFQNYASAVTKRQWQRRDLKYPACVHSIILREAEHGCWKTSYGGSRPYSMWIIVQNCCDQTYFSSLNHSCSCLRYRRSELDRRSVRSLYLVCPLFPGSIDTINTTCTCGTRYCLLCDMISATSSYVHNCCPNPGDRAVFRWTDSRTHKTSFRCERPPH